MVPGKRQVEPRVTSSITDQNLLLVKSALATYQKAQDALRQGDWAEYGRYQQELGQIWQQLNRDNRVK